MENIHEVNELDKSGLCSVQLGYQFVCCIDFVWLIRVSFYPVKYVSILFNLLSDFVKKMADISSEILLVIFQLISHCT